MIDKPLLGEDVYLDPGLSDGIVGLWLMNEGSGSTVADLSGRQNNGTLTDSTWFSGKFGPCLNNGGGNDRMTIPHSSDFDFPSGFTLSAWANPDGAVAVDEQIIYQYDLDTDDGFILGRNNLPDTWNFAVYVNNTNDVVVSNDAPVSKRWTFLTGVRENNGALKLYINGVLQSDTGTKAGTVNSTSDVYVGSGFGGTADNFDGKLDNVIIYNRALTASEVIRLYQDPFCMFKRNRIELWSTAVAAGVTVPVFIHHYQQAGGL